MSLGSVLWEVNPRRRRRKLTAKQIAAGFGGKRGRKRGGRRAHSRRRRRSVVTAAPVVHRRRRRSASRGMRRSRRGRRGFSMRGAASGFMPLLKSGAVGGAGAVVVDVGMGYAMRFLPASLATPVDAAGQPQYGYFGAKAALALLLGTYGRRLPVIGNYASRMAEGSLTVLAYQFMRPMAAGFMPVGYFNPAPTMRPMNGLRGEMRATNQPGNYVAGLGNVRAYVSGNRNQYVGNVRGLRSVRAYESAGPGTAAAQAVKFSSR